MAAKLNKIQKKSLAIYCYDVSKIALSGAVIGSIIEKEVFNPLLLVSGLIVSIFFLLIGLRIEKSKI